MPFQVKSFAYVAAVHAGADIRLARITKAGATLLLAAGA